MILILMPAPEVYELVGGCSCGDVLNGPPGMQEVILPCGHRYLRAREQPAAKSKKERRTVMQEERLFAGLEARPARPRAPKRGSRRGKAAPQRYQDPDDDIPFALGPELD